MKQLALAAVLLLTVGCSAVGFEVRNKLERAQFRADKFTAKVVKANEQIQRLQASQVEACLIVAAREQDVESVLSCIGQGAEDQPAPAPESDSGATLEEILSGIA